VRLPDELRASPCFLLMSLGYRLKGRGMKELAVDGLGPFHYGVLSLLAERERESQATIAEALQVDRSQVVGLLDELEERGLIERRRDQSDRRRHVVSLTAGGEQVLAEFRSALKRFEDEVLAPLDQESRQALHELLLRVACHYDSRFRPE
jgi:DNA-binding MarR family transcriptional regulator